MVAIRQFFARRYFCVLKGIALIILLAACQLSPGPESAQDLDLSIRGDVRGVTDESELQVWVLPAEVWDGPDNTEAPVFTEETESEYLRLVDEQRAFFLSRPMGDTESIDQSGTTRFRLKPGTYHAGVSVRIDPEAEEPDYWGGSFISWDNPRQYVCGNLDRAVGIRDGETARISIDLQNPDENTWPEPEGCLLWTFATGLPMSESASIDQNGTIYVPARWNLYALDAEGREQWVFSEGNDVSHAAIGDDGSIYVHERGVSNDSTLYAVDPESGAIDWSFQTNGMTGNAPAVSMGNTVYAGSNFAEFTERLFAVDGETGTQNWSYITDPQGIISAVVIDPNDDMYMVGQNGRLWAVENLVEAGNEVWELIWNDTISSDLALGPTGEIYFGTFGNEVVAIGADSGDELWAEPFITGGTVRSTPAVGPDGTVYVGSDDGTLYALDGSDGSLIWEFTRPAAEIQSAPTIGDDGTIYFGSHDGRLYAVNSEDGTERWSIATRDRITASPLLAPDGTLYFGSRTGTFYAVSTRSTGLANAPWPTLGGDSQRTGRHPDSGMVD